MEQKSQKPSREIIIKDLAIQELQEVYEIEKSSFSSPWSYELWQKELSNPLSHNLIAKIEGEVIGYLCYWLVACEAHLLRIAIKREYRGKGYAKLLISKMKESLPEGIEIYLEVRDSNWRAIRFYESIGFKKIGVRKGYYTPEKEDAILMALKNKV